jgi:hypothetical protein
VHRIFLNHAINFGNKREKKTLEIFFCLKGNVLFQLRPQFFYRLKYLLWQQSIFVSENKQKIWLVQICFMLLNVKKRVISFEYLSIILCLGIILCLKPELNFSIADENFLEWL